MLTLSAPKLREKMCVVGGGWCGGEGKYLVFILRQQFDEIIKVRDQFSWFLHSVLTSIYFISFHPLK